MAGLSPAIRLVRARGVAIKRPVHYRIVPMSRRRLFLALFQPSGKKRADLAAQGPGHFDPNRRVRHTGPIRIRGTSPPSYCLVVLVSPASSATASPVPSPICHGRYPRWPGRRKTSSYAPLMAPEVTPSMSWRWKIKKTMITGIEPRVAAASRMPYW